MATETPITERIITGTADEKRFVCEVCRENAAYERCALLLRKVRGGPLSPVCVACTRRILGYAVAGVGIEDLADIVLSL